MKYISMKIEPKGRIPPRIEIISGSMNQRFSGIGRGTALTRHGKFGAPEIFFPITVPTSVRGKITKPARAIRASIVVTKISNHLKIQPVDLHGIALEAW
jgi:hypothetical protein